MSDFEKLVGNLLRAGGIKYEREKVFPDIYNGLYRYDYYLPEKNCCIECNGMQHYIYTKFFHKKKSDFTKAKERDRRKIRGLAAKGMDLYIIPYWEMEQLHSAADLFQEKFHAKTQFHNDIVWHEHQNNIITR